jgi:eukaryotic-like serine/threonine-protein kinase
MLSLEGTGRLSSASYGRYELLARIGSGGMAEVFLAMSQGLAGFNKLVVLKRLRPDVAKDKAMITMFLDEARLAARLQHPNIVNTYEVGEQGGTYFIAMEYLEGQPLNRVLKHASVGSLFRPEMWCHVFAQALSGLHHAHEQRGFDGQPLEIVHRDLSPHNVFLTYSGEAKIVDFGIARATMNVATTGTGMLKGKANYMSPEQVRGEADRRSDIFAIGLGLWEALAGHGVYRGEPMAVLHRVLNEPIPLLAEARPDLDPKLCAIVMKALEKEPDRRYQTAKELRDALDAFVRDQGVEVRDEAVGDTLAKMFQTLRDQVAARVKECVVELASRQDEAPMSGSALPSLKLTNQTGESEVVLVESLREESGTPKWAAAVPPSLTTAVAAPPPSAGTAPAPSRGLTRTKWAVGVLGAVAIVGTALVASRGMIPAPRATPATPATIRVALDSTPSGAAIEKDGQVIGHTPATLDLPGGHHELALVHEGFAREIVVVDGTGTQSVLLRAMDSNPIVPSVSASPALSAPAKSVQARVSSPIRPAQPVIPPIPSVKPGRKIRTDL